MMLEEYMKFDPRSESTDGLYHRFYHHYKCLLVS